jgi:DNA-binding XRE family transcriptional regulator
MATKKTELHPDIIHLNNNGKPLRDYQIKLINKMVESVKNIKTNYEFEFNHEIFCKNLKKLRVKKGISQNILALSLGINQKTYEAYESGRNMPTLAVLIRLQQFYKTDLFNLLTVNLLL